MEPEVSEIALFFGRFHPLVLHLPIGFLVIAFVLEMFSRFSRFRQYRPAVGLVLSLGAISAAIAAGLGYLLTLAGGYDEDILAVHQWSGITLAVAALIAATLYWQRERKQALWLDKAYLGVLFLMMASLAVAGHYGGSLTHGSDYLTQYMPNSLRRVAGLPPKKSNQIRKITNLQEAVVFEDIIYPILDARCVSCHNPGKSKGDLMMHTREAILKGGENGPLFVAGDAAASEMMKRIHLPENDEDHMPPKGKSQLSSEQIELIHWWINEGAPFDKTVAEVSVDEKVQLVLNTLLDPEANKTEVEKLLSSAIPPADAAVVSQLKRKGIQVVPLASDVHWLQARVYDAQLTDTLMHDLSKIAPQLTWLKLGGATTTEKGLSALVQFQNLTRLHLEHATISDKDFQYLNKLPYLEYLNLYGTPVSDEGILQLAGLKNLKNLYVWQTQVTKQGAMELQRLLPALKIVTGQDIETADSVQSLAAPADRGKGAPLDKKKLAIAED